MKTNCNQPHRAFMTLVMKAPIKSIYFWALPSLLLACRPRLSRFYAAASTLSFFGSGYLSFVGLKLAGVATEC
jgi:hypothetical protein